MGYQLVFWQQADDAPSPDTTYRSFMNDAPPPGLRQLPLPAILAAIDDEFPGIDPAPSANGSQPVFWEDEDSSTSVEFGWSEVHVVAELRPAGRWSSDVANQIIDLFDRFDCPLYDPQTNERFDSTGT